MTRRPPERDPLVELADDAVHGSAVRARREERSRRERSAEIATWVGTLRDLAERQLPVTIHSASDRLHRGTLIALGRDHLAVRQSAGSVLLLALATVRLVRPEPGAIAPAAAGDREHAQDRTLIEALARITEGRHEVALWLADLPDGLKGEVLGLGEDVLTLRMGVDRQTVYVPVDAITELVWTPMP